MNALPRLSMNRDFDENWFDDTTAPCPTCKGKCTVNPLTLGVPDDFFCVGVTECPTCDGTGECP